ncbi:MAG: hypothetical protein AVDCRST_MAG60-277 [uncultured Nocardioides sp.]|uniref:Uncharacterized protein n=1 Tax=uncultured Nocardioides sp. TaxID=198441 RepID=A0A6J4N2V9_9ACTN|nr:MAG: hypothetical protein AVDCRST_MAG60-277 [uncultured Nocardioides sp.]
MRHHALDPVVNGAPWAAAAYGLYRGARAVRQR